MRTFIRYALLPLLAMLLCGCGAVHEEKIDGPYYLIALDELREMEVSYKVDDGGYVTRIPGTVFAVGWNDEYIVAKRHPGGHRYNIQYYYLVRELDGEFNDPDISVRGPLTEGQFAAAKAQKSLPDFSLTVQALE